MNRDPNKTVTRKLFYKTQKEYKKLIKNKRRKYEENMTEKLENLFSEDRNEFWKYLKSMTNKKQNEENLPKIDRLVKHFKTLYFDEHIENDMNNGREINDELQNKYEDLNTEFTENEVSKCLNNLKSKKAPGDDLITNEMIKCTNGEGMKLLTKLFNTILNLGYFPIEWNYGLLRLIHKDGDRDDEDNYRAITLNTVLGNCFVQYYKTG